MGKYVWCEDYKSGFQFWQVLFKALYPDIIVETQNNNSRLNTAVSRINDDGNYYYVIIDSTIDNPDVLREVKRLKKTIEGKTNVKIIEIRSFEFSLLSFEFLEEWVFAEKDELKEKRSDLLEARKIFVDIGNNGGDIDALISFKAVYNFFENKNEEKLASKILYEITKNTGFETDKSKVGPCFIYDCCEWTERQKDDICGLDNKRLSVLEKMRQILEYSALKSSFKEAGL